MIAGIVLAGGASSRFGATKQVAILRGEPLAQHAIDALAGAGIADIVVVLGHDADAVEAALALPAGARTVVNPRWTEGQASSLGIGLGAAADSDAVVVLLADQPGITAGHVRALVDAYRADPAPIVRLRFDDAPGPALLAAEVYADAMELEGDTGARALIARRPDAVREVRVPGPAPRDVDTAEDLRDA